MEKHKKSKIGAADGRAPIDVAKKRRIEADLLGQASTTSKTDLVTILKTLRRNGMLSDIAPWDESMGRRELQHAIEAHGNAMTPYGAVVQQMPLGIPELQSWDFINLFALLYYLSSKSKIFSDLMRTAMSGSRDNCLNIVLYVDEVTPGNPFRFDQARCIQCVYWCFLEWPSWVLSRRDIWPIFGILRSSVTKQTAARRLKSDEHGVPYVLAHCGAIHV